MQQKNLLTVRDRRILCPKSASNYVAKQLHNVTTENSIIVIWKLLIVSAPIKTYHAADNFYRIQIFCRFEYILSLETKSWNIKHLKKITRSRVGFNMPI